MGKSDFMMRPTLVKVSDPEKQCPIRFRAFCKTQNKPPLRQETLASASPPDVRNGCALPSGCTSDWAAPSLRGQIIRAPGEGIAQFDVRRLRQGIAIPHIRAAEPKLTFRKRTNHLCSVTFAKGSKAYRTLLPSQASEAVD